MSAAIDLIRALLGRPVEDSEARAALTLALEAEIDPLRWCAIHFGLGEGEAMRRAAAWADLAFYDAVPRLAHADLQPDRLEMLANVQMFRVQLLDRDVAFAAPDFFGVLRLQQARQRDPDLRKHVCLVPGNALRSFLAQAAAPALVDGARQNLARRWPYATAQLDLTRAVRRSFTAIVIILVGLLVSAPFSGQMWVLPIWVGLVALPVALRVAVMFVPLKPSARVPPFVDAADLPIYSVLVPLRDEANMVSQLFAALKQINYPSDKLDILLVVEQRSSYRSCPSAWCN